MTTSSSSLSSSLNYGTTIGSHLASVTKNLEDSKSKKIHIIIGNEAGDADSIISALTLSHVNAIGTSQASRDDSKCGANSISLPLASINRDDLALRRDVVLILEAAGIDVDKIVYLDDDTFVSISKDDNVDKEITLVDHNRIRSDLEGLKNDVVEILDHHQDEMAHESVLGEMRKIAFEGQAALVGSTCTLITERLMEIEFDESAKVDAGLGVMLLGVILLDTMNMSKEAAKGTARDERAIDFLMEKTDWNSLEIKDEVKSKICGSTDSIVTGQLPNRSLYFEYLRDSKFDSSFWESMSPRDALRIDYKRFEPSTGSTDGTFGLSSVLLSLEKLVAKDGFYHDAVSYMDDVDVDLLGVMTMVIVNDTPQREMLLLGKSDRVTTLTKYLLEDQSASHLQMAGAKIEDKNEAMAKGNYSVSLLKQGNPKGSRKQVAPVIMGFYNVDKN